MVTLIEQANAYFTRGWLPIPLGMDDKGKPKRPIDTGWQRTPRTAEAIKSLSWDKAVGIGIVGGPVSQNLAIIDIDNPNLATAVFAYMARQHRPWYFVWTGRHNCHIYVNEERASRSTRFKVEFEGESLGVELRCEGNQVAAPPSPGYLLARETQPATVPSVGLIWNELADKFSLPLVEAGQIQGAGANYPKPWQEEVPEGDRNNTVFVEACRLCEAGMPIRAAMETMLARYQMAYAKDNGLSQREIEATVRSAFRKAEPKLLGGLHQRYTDELPW